LLPLSSHYLLFSHFPAAAPSPCPQRAPAAVLELVPQLLKLFIAHVEELEQVDVRVAVAAPAPAAAGGGEKDRGEGRGGQHGDEKAGGACRMVKMCSQGKPVVRRQGRKWTEAARCDKSHPSSPSACWACRTGSEC